ncbi:hypothetical protein HYV79_00815 [Candidatus Woesearchaeota archaeon]|nr:hypothetical protein [Candidatus Woesearchaeota archaeon]
MLRLLWSPGSLIEDLRGKPSFGLAFFTLVISTLIICGSIVLFSFVSQDSKILLKTTGTIFVAVIVIVFYLAALLTAIMKTLSGNGSYTAGLSSLSLPMMPLSVALLLIVLANIVNITSQTIIAIYTMWIITGLSTPFLLVLSISTIFRALKELFETNMITALLGFFLLKITVIALLLASTTQYWLPLLIIAE